jgi:hypothetical protein
LTHEEDTGLDAKALSVTAWPGTRMVERADVAIDIGREARAVEREVWEADEVTVGPLEFEVDVTGLMVEMVEAVDELTGTTEEVITAVLNGVAGKVEKTGGLSETLVLIERLDGEVPAELTPPVCCKMS